MDVLAAEVAKIKGEDNLMLDVPGKHNHHEVRGESYDKNVNHLVSEHEDL